MPPDHRFQIHLLCILCSWALTGTLACSPTFEHGQRQHPPTHIEASATSDATRSAERQLLASLKAAEDLGDGNPLLMSILYSLATFYRQQGNFEKAEVHYQRALALKERIAGPNHPDVATILYEYAALLRDANRHREAENLIARANAIMAKHHLRRSR